MTVLGPTLPGHASTPERLAHATWRDWYEAVDEAVTSLQRDCEQVALVGQSLGGLLALYMAAERSGELAAVASLAAPLWLTPVGRAAVAVSRWIPRLTMLPKTGIDIRNAAMKKRIPTYDVIPTAPLRSLVELAETVHSRLREITCPTLVMHSTKDHTAPYECSRVIADGVSSEYVRHRTFDASYHLLSLDYERNIVAAEIVSFLEHHFSRGEMR